MNNGVVIAFGAAAMVGVIGLLVSFRLPRTVTAAQSLSR